MKPAAKPTRMSLSDDDGNRLPAIFVDTNGCWIWTRSLNGGGYAMQSNKAFGEHSLVHRAIWEEFNGPMPEGLQSDHLCRVRSCVNPAHIEPVTNRVNILRGVSFAARFAKRTECVNGHLFSGRNLGIYMEGKSQVRRCRTCQKKNNVRYRLITLGQIPRRKGRDPLKKR